MARPGGNPDLKMVRNEDTDSANAKRRALAHAYAMSTAEKLLDASRQQSGMTDTQYAEWLNAEGWPTDAAPSGPPPKFVEYFVIWG